MSTSSTAFDLLHPRVQHFLWSQGWTELRDIQEQAIHALIPSLPSPSTLTAGTRPPADLVLAASTASGKTEAAFLPLISQILFEQDALEANAVEASSLRNLIVYVSPLKALINDQFCRLTLLCEQLDIPVWPWHGDIGSQTKKRFLKERRGVLLITPESLEAFFCGQGSQAPHVFERVRAVVVDELHAFMGEERGKQMQSLLHRMDSCLSRQVQRIGLSATLGDMATAAQFLRPSASVPAKIIDSRSGGELLVVVKGYVEPIVPAKIKTLKNARDTNDALALDEATKQLAAQAMEQGLELNTTEGSMLLDAGVEMSFEDAGQSLDLERQTSAHIAEHLFKTMRGSNNLVFPNTRNAVEKFALKLRALCAEHQVPNEFWPHHGSLSRELREEAEQVLKAGQTCATAICTNTLELGLDIGAVKSVAQVGTPPSVSSLRQRLGRSGRREGEPSILRGYCQELALTPQSHLLTGLREELVQMTAMVQLLLKGWYEPAQSQGLHYSTLVQQLLALIAERGGIEPVRAYQLLCKTGPFGAVSSSAFASLLRHLGKSELLVQDSSGVLLHGAKSERLVNHYTFYAAFATQEEYRLVCAGRTLGAIPLTNALSLGDLLVFGGRTWRVTQIDSKSHVVEVARTKAGKAPRFESDASFVHTRVRQEMRQVYESTQDVPFLDDTAQELLAQGRDTYKRHDLKSRSVVSYGSSTLLFTWLGDRENQALALILKRKGIKANALGLAVELSLCSLSEAELMRLLTAMGKEAVPTAAQLLEGADNLVQEKWDWALPLPLLQQSYASLKLNIAGAHAWLAALK